MHTKVDAFKNNKAQVLQYKTELAKAETALQDKKEATQKLIRNLDARRKEVTLAELAYREALVAQNRLDRELSQLRKKVADLEREGRILSRGIEQEERMRRLSQVRKK